VNTFEGASQLVSFSPDSKMLASVSWDGKLIIRELPSGDIRLVIEGFLIIDNASVKNGYFASIEHFGAALQ
jgi:WD40 repeat protein